MLFVKQTPLGRGLQLCMCCSGCWGFSRSLAWMPGFLRAVSVRASSGVNHGTDGAQRECVWDLKAFPLLPLWTLSLWTCLLRSAWEVVFVLKIIHVVYVFQFMCRELYRGRSGNALYCPRHFQPLAYVFSACFCLDGVSSCFLFLFLTFSFSKRTGFWLLVLFVFYFIPHEILFCFY